MAERILVGTAITPQIKVAVHVGQMRVLASAARIVAAIAGTGSGKTTAGPIWLVNLIGKHWQDPAADQRYLVSAPTYSLLRVAFDTLAPYLRAIGRMGIGESSDGWMASTRTWHLRSGAQVRFVSADNPAAMEGVHYRAAWCDEWGQVSDYQHETVRRRLAFHQGSWLITTTPYPEYKGSGALARTWLRRMIDAFEAGTDEATEVVRFPSWWNPAYPREEIVRLRKVLSPWMFAMFHEGILTRPAGAIYDIFSPAEHLIPEGELALPITKLAVPERRAAAERQGWRLYAGMDFGASHETAVVWGALSPKGILYIIGERFIANRTMRSHIVALGGEILDKNGELVPFDGLGFGPLKPERVFCDPSGKQSILDLRDADLEAMGADSDVEEGIRAVYERLATKELVILQGRCPHLVRELEAYRRDEAGRPVRVEVDLCDALRYLVMGIKRLQRASKVHIRFV